MNVMLKDVKMFIVDDKIKLTLRDLSNNPNAIPFVCTPIKEYEEIDKKIYKAYPTNQFIYVMINGGQELTEKQKRLLNVLHEAFLSDHSTDLILQYIGMISTKYIREIENLLNKYSSYEQLATIKQNRDTVNAI